MVTDQRPTLKITLLAGFRVGRISNIQLLALDFLFFPESLFLSYFNIPSTSVFFSQLDKNSLAGECKVDRTVRSPLYLRASIEGEKSE